MQFEPYEFDESKNPNISHDVSQLKELAHMGGYLCVAVVVFWLLVETLVYVLPSVVSLEREKRWLGGIGSELTRQENTRRDDKLQRLADDLAARMGVPSGVVEVWVSSGDTVNAFATFGGNVLMYQGLLDRLPDEEAVAAVLAHEIAHVKHRDPLRGSSRGLLFAVASAAVSGDTGMAQLAASLEGLRYSRTLEAAADEAAVQALIGRYGNGGGMVRLMQTFEQVEAENGTAEGPQWLHSHPDTRERLLAASRQAEKMPHTSHPAPNVWRQ